MLSSSASPKIIQPINFLPEKLKVNNVIVECNAVIKG